MGGHVHGPHECDDREHHNDEHCDEDNDCVN